MLCRSRSWPCTLSCSFSVSTSRWIFSPSSRNCTKPCGAQQRQQQAREQRSRCEGQRSVLTAGRCSGGASGGASRRPHWASCSPGGAPLRTSPYSLPARSELPMALSSQGSRELLLPLPPPPPLIPAAAVATSARRRAGRCVGAAGLAAGFGRGAAWRASCVGGWVRVVAQPSAMSPGAPPPRPCTTKTRAAGRLAPAASGPGGRWAWGRAVKLAWGRVCCVARYRRSTG